MNSETTVGQRLREERKRLGLSRDSMAMLCGLRSTKTQYSYEQNKTSLKKEYLAKASSAGVDIAYVLLGQRLENTATNAVELALLRNARALQKKGLALQALALVNAFREGQKIPLYEEGQ